MHHASTEFSRPVGAEYSSLLEKPPSAVPLLRSRCDLALSASATDIKEEDKAIPHLNSVHLPPASVRILRRQMEFAMVPLPRLHCASLLIAYLIGFSVPGIMAASSTPTLGSSAARKTVSVNVGKPLHQFSPDSIIAGVGDVRANPK